MSDIIILETKEAKLYKDRFIYDDQTYPIDSIEKASFNSGGFFGSPHLIIDFKNGFAREFVVGTVSTASHLNTFFSGFLLDTGSQELTAAAQQWATAINTLIANREKTDESNASLKAEVDQLRKEIAELKRKNSAKDF